MFKKVFQKSWGPNCLTGLRCILGVWIGVRLQEHMDLTLMTLFVCVILTDVLDGWWARSYHMTSKLGTVLDPLADKIMVISVVFGLVKRGVIPKWFLYLTLIKEITLVFGGLYGMHKQLPLNALRWGKVAMFGQCLLLVLAMSRILYPWYHIGYEVYIGCVTAIMMIAWITYLLRTKDMWHDKV
ncbi:CDP-alcohol phosphatidyltransferase family protein [Holospora curviuscula]|uniref:CDP-diacylglycerol--glycerol-3-phosphate 3-phosphatidyltransferase n=1 Tax=Holospora curviuscula TaxID=1082868 RepID=A0A2S5RI12_9PROT|nr:CDP-alcohol phosphatidyltransferase family protein [Holospora curviuscula]PPE06943.1 putative CDP-diacylglycerol--glycerol-3-phosphate 3-phosphatidyl-transferase 2 [Holospora curviuscula]